MYGSWCNRSNVRINGVPEEEEEVLGSGNSLRDND